MAVSSLLYGAKTWLSSGRVQAAEMRFLRGAKGCTKLDRILNDDIRNDPILNKKI